MPQAPDWSGFHIKANDIVPIVVPCLEFVLFLDTTDDACILDFYNRTREALGSRITHYQAESMKGFKKLNARGESMVPTWFSKPRGGKPNYYITLCDNDPNESITASRIELSVFRRPAEEVTPEIKAQWKLMYEEQKRGTPHPGSELRVTLPLDHPLAEPEAIRDWILGFSLVKTGADFTGHCGYALNHYRQLVKPALFNPAVKALASLVLRYPGLGWSGAAILPRILRYEPSLSAFVPLIKRANWLNLVCDKTLNLIGGRSQSRAMLEDDLVRVHEVAHGVVIQAGPTPQLGDLANRDFVEPYRRVAKVLKPIRVAEMAGMGAGFMSAATNEWLNAFDDLAGIVALPESRPATARPDTAAEPATARPDRAAEPALDFWVAQADEQELLISVEGEDVLNFKDNLKGPAPKDEMPLPDPVDAFVEAARLGMFTNSWTPPWQSSAELLGKDVDLQLRKQTWRVLLRNIDPGAYRVLTNILRARFLNSISVRTNSPASVEGADDALINLSRLEYPSPYKPIPYDLDFERPDRRNQGRYLQIIFASKPDAATAQVVFRAMETWTWLMMLGGYPADDMHPKQSAALPEPAFEVDSHTIEQAFPELFLCDDDCYAAVINWAQSLHVFTSPLQQLLLR